MSTSHYCWGKKFGQFTRKCFSNDAFWLPLSIMSKRSRGSLWEYTKFKIKMVKIYAPFQTKTAENHVLWDDTFLSSLHEGAPRSSQPHTPYHYLLPLPPSLWIVRLNKFNVKILSAWIAVFSTRLRTGKKKEKRQTSRYAIKKLKMKYELGADASKTMMFAMTRVMAAAREHISYTSTIVIFSLHLPL